MRTVQEVRIENRLRQMRTGQLKQATVSAFDRQLYRDAAETLGIDQYLTLHPAWMYQTLQPFMQAERGLAFTESRLRYAPLPIPQIQTTLPAKYVAVSFYARSTWEPTVLTASCAKETIQAIAKQIPVVLLTTGLHMDDHLEYIPKPLPENVFLLHEHAGVTIQNSLAVYSAAMHGARAFVGTYGGISHLALRYGIPSVNLFTEWKGIFLSHRQLSEAYALQLGVPYHVLKVAEIPLIQDTLPRIVLQTAGSSRAQKTLALSEQTV